MLASMRETVIASIPAPALAALRALEASGHEVWFVGGCVRDACMGRRAHDIDMATSARWEDVRDVFLSDGRSVFETGTAHGTVTVGYDGLLMEITTYRSEGCYSDGRHPDSVTFIGDIEADLSRRDFTMNAVAFHPERGLLDPFGGVADIEHGIIRAVGNARARFKEDPLRIMRAARFFSQLGFSLDSATAAAAHELAFLVGGVSRERIEREFSSLLTGCFAGDAIMEFIDVIGEFVPEALAMKGLDQKTPYHVYDVLGHTAHAVDATPPRRIVRYAMFFHDIGKPRVFTVDEQGIGHAYGHAAESAEITHAALRRLRLSRRDSERIVALVRMHGDIIQPTAKSVRRALAKLGGDVALMRDLLDVKRGDAASHAPEHRGRARLADEVEEVLDTLVRERAAFSLRDLGIDGNDAIACGIEPGPQVGRALRSAFDAVVEEEIPNSREELLAFLRAFAARE